MESSYEYYMVQHLVSCGRHFKKPLVGNVTELFLNHRLDMVLYDTKPKTIIEVAGYQNEQYRQICPERKKHTKVWGINMWNGTEEHKLKHDSSKFFKC